ncbi:Atrial natriuretic peptide-converting enzyme [Varanus komodoensis]|nr:Atrial natriuretic peptide-converting enzyme [Varanus komodoensis]
MHVPVTDEDNMEDGCSQKLASAKYFRLLLLILIPCICALILLLVILITFVGVLGKKCFYENGSDLLGTESDTEMLDIPFPNITDSGSNMAPSRGNKMQPSSWTTSPLFHVDQMHKNFSIHKEATQVISQTPVLKTSPADERILTKGPGDTFWSSVKSEEETPWSTGTPMKVIDKTSSLPRLKPTHPPAVQGIDLKMGSCINITYNQCQMLPYNHTTLRPVLSIVKSIEMEKFLKFFSYLNRLSCYQHIMLFGCSLALPECISDGVDRYLGTKVVMDSCPVDHFVRLQRKDVNQFLGCSKTKLKTVIQPGSASLHNEKKESNCFVKVMGASSVEVEFAFQEYYSAMATMIVMTGVMRRIADFMSGISFPFLLCVLSEPSIDCSEGLFRCNTGKCLNYTFVCDGYDDCGDISDEQNCDCNPVTQHRCGDGRCIKMDWVCDGDHDCMDKSDEANCCK